MRGAPAQSHDRAHGNADEALTPKEQDAFQEIARALIAASKSTLATATVCSLTDAAIRATEAEITGTHQEEVDALASLAPALLDHLPIGVMIARGAKIAYANRALLEWLGYADLKTLEGAGGLEHIFIGQTPDSRTGQDAPGSMEVLTQTGERLGVEARLQTIDWDGPAALISLQRAPSREGADLARSQAEARLEAERASAAKSDFLAKVSHEIRTPLSAILGFTEVMMEEQFGPIGNERYKEYLKDIYASGAHVLSLVNDLLDLSKIEAGKMELKFESVDLNAAIAECISIIQTQASRARVVMRQSLAPQLPNIRVDRRSLKQILLNLLSNAVKFNQPGGQVIVSSALADTGCVMLRVKDTGVGMSDKEIEAAFEPFRRLGELRDVNGTGLGLPLTRALIEANQASFTIASRKYEGTLVEVAFAAPQALAAQ